MVHIDRLLAALMFFTRLPFWRVKKVEAECFSHVVDYWPLTGWLTGGVTVLVWWLAAPHFHIIITALLAVSARILLTGALHEDGLADFFDGFGGGTSRERTLAIMKDSHIGTYGVLGLILYMALLVTALSTLPYALPVIFTADVYAKVCGSFLILQLPYARTAETSKSGVVYVAWNGMRIASHLGRCAMALLPCAVWMWYALPVGPWLSVPFLIPPAVELILCALMRRRLGGYTGDCCGAVFLLCELSFLLASAYMIY